MREPITWLAAVLMIVAAVIYDTCTHDYRPFPSFVQFAEPYHNYFAVKNYATAERDKDGFAHCEFHSLSILSDQRYVAGFRPPDGVGSYTIWCRSDGERLVWTKKSLNGKEVYP